MGSGGLKWNPHFLMEETHDEDDDGDNDDYYDDNELTWLRLLQFHANNSHQERIKICHRILRIVDASGYSR